MIDYNTILFDLDGTLTDSSIGIINSVVYALNKYSIVVEDKKTLFKFIGPPLLESFENYCGFSHKKAHEAIQYYREYYKEKGIYENKVYSGIEQLLIELYNGGKTLVVATSKPEIFASQILKHFNLDHYFTYIAGANLDGTRTKKADVIQYALDSLGSNVMPPVVMIGDREYDINGASSMGIDSIGVLFGYGSRDELVNAGATYIADTPSDIGKLLLI